MRLQKEELVPLYVKRSLEGYPGTNPLSGLAGGYETIARYLPVGSPVLLFALQRLAQRAQRILRKPGGLLQPGLDLVSLLAHLMLLIDYNVSIEFLHKASQSYFGSMLFCVETAGCVALIHFSREGLYCLCNEGCTAMLRRSVHGPI